METIIDELIQRWRSGDKVPCEQLINDGNLNHEQQLELICMELLIRRELGESPRLDEFLTRFPHYQKELEAHFALEDFLSTEGRPVSLPSREQIAPYENADWPLSVRTELTHPLSVGSGGSNLTVEFDPNSDLSITDDLSIHLAGRRFGDYMLLRVLGKGGMGLVFEARQISLNRIVALKMMRGDWQNAKGRKQFKREAQAIAGLDFPHIVKILEAGEINGNPYYTMKVMAGGSLAEHLEEYTGQTHKAVELVATIAEALSHVHDRGIVHRDIKHSNILLDAEKRPHLSDFGLCRDLLQDPSTTIANGNVIGTPMFLAPEQIETGFGKISPATDVYALGVILFHLVVGHPPFYGKSVMQVLWGSVHKEPDFQEVPEIELAKILRGCLAKRASERYENAGQLAEQLSAWLGQKKERPPIIGRMIRSLKQLKRKKTILVGGISCLLLLIVAKSIYQSISTRQNIPELDSILEGHNKARLIRDDEIRKRTIVENSLFAKRGESPKLNFLDRLMKRKERAILETKSGGNSEVLAVCFSSDGAYMAWSHRKGNIKIRHRPSSKVLDNDAIKTFTPVWTMAFHPQQNILAWGAQDGFVTIFDVTKQNEVIRFPVSREGVGDVEFTRDGKYLICACAKMISTWDLEELLERRSSQPKPNAIPIVLASNVQTVSQIQSSDRIVFCGEDGYVRVWDWRNHRQLREEKISNGALHNVVVSPDGNRIAAGGGDGIVRLLDAETLKVNHEFNREGGNWIRGLAFSPDGRRLVSTSDNGDIRLWDIFERRELSYVGTHSKPEMSVRSLSVAFAPDGQHFATAGDDNKCRVWEIDKIENDGFLSVGDSAIRSISVGSKIAALGCDDGQIRMFDLRLKTLLPPIKTKERSIEQLAISPDETMIAFIGLESSLSLWDVSQGVIVSRSALEVTEPCGLSFSADGRLGIGAKDFALVWYLPRLQLQYKIPTSCQFFNQVSFQQGLQKIAYVDADLELPKLRIRDLDRDDEISTVVGNFEDARGIKFSPSGKKLAAIVANGDVKVREIGVPDSIVQRDFSMSVFSCVDFSGDAEILAAGDRNGYVQLFDLKTKGESPLALHHGGEITNVAFSMDGDFLVSTSDNGTVKIWDARPLFEE
jgi:eukaryotic-like serine/threonine-protein kinase